MLIFYIIRVIIQLINLGLQIYFPQGIPINIDYAYILKSLVYAMNQINIHHATGIVYVMGDSLLWFGNIIADYCITAGNVIAKMVSFLQGSSYEAHIESIIKILTDLLVLSLGEMAVLSLGYQPEEWLNINQHPTIIQKYTEYSISHGFSYFQAIDPSEQLPHFSEHSANPINNPDITVNEKTEDIEKQRYYYYLNLATGITIIILANVFLLYINRFIPYAPDDIPYTVINIDSLRYINDYGDISYFPTEYPADMSRFFSYYESRYLFGFNTYHGDCVSQMDDLYLEKVEQMIGPVKRLPPVVESEKNSYVYQQLLDLLDYVNSWFF